MYKFTLSNLGNEQEALLPKIKPISLITPAKLKINVEIPKYFPKKSKKQITARSFIPIRGKLLLAGEGLFLDLSDTDHLDSDADGFRIFLYNFLPEVNGFTLTLGFASCLQDRTDKKPVHTFAVPGMSQPNARGGQKIRAIRTNPRDAGEAARQCDPFPKK